MYYLQNIRLKYGDRELFKDVSFMFTPKDRIGLVGRNGAGKTTLLKIMSKEIIPDEGSAQYPKDARIGFLKQFLPENQKVSIIDEVCKAFDEYNRVEAESREIEKGLETVSGDEEMIELLDRLDKVNTKLATFDITNPEAEASKVLKGLGFRENQLHDSLDTLSGGWVMRVELAKLLLSKPDILLLDEPTNHLDIEAILWFESYIKKYPACVIIISHDETFMQNTVNRIIEIELGRVDDYKYSYQKYLIEKKQRKEILMSQYNNQQKAIKEKERTITRFMAKATKTKMAQSMAKQLAKMERVEVFQEDTSGMKLKFPYAGREGQIAYKATDLGKAYDELQVLKNVNLQIERGDKVAFIGQNGQGKTTLSKIMADLTPHTEGESKIGHNAQLSIYLQDQSDKIDPKKSVLEVAEYHGGHYNNTEIRSILGAFMFSGEDVEKKVSVLSGGEKARVALACMVMHPSNILILDEPTNHLDVVSKQILKDAVKSYEGTLIVVSHDRTFLQGLTDKTYEFINTKIIEHLGDIEYVLAKRKHDDLRDYAVNTKSANKPQVVAEKKNDLSFDERKKLNRELTYLERDIEKLETKIKEIETQMLDPDFFKSQDAFKVTKEIDEMKAQIATKMERWEEVSEKLD